MSSKIFAAAAIICSLFVAIQAASLSKSDTSTTFVSDLATYLSEHPELKVTTELKPSESSNNTIRFTFGKRLPRKSDLSLNMSSLRVVNLFSIFLLWIISGDGVAIDDLERRQYDRPLNVAFARSHSVLGGIITLIQVDVKQSSGIVRCFIADGGFAHRNIRLVVEAKNTTYFDQHTQIFRTFPWSGR